MIIFIFEVKQSVNIPYEKYNLPLQPNMLNEQQFILRLYLLGRYGFLTAQHLSKEKMIKKML